jgi:hypothetical protein
MITKPEDAVPRNARIDSPDGFGTEGALCFTVEECAQIAINYSIAVLDYVNGQSEVQINGGIEKEKYDALFSRWMMNAAIDRFSTRNAKEISKHEDSKIIDELKRYANKGVAP